MFEKNRKVYGVLESVIPSSLGNALRKSKSAVSYWWRGLNAAIYPKESGSLKQLNLPFYHINEVVSGYDSIPVNLVNYYHTYGDMPLDELIILCKLIRYHQPKIVFEIGTYLGGTTLQIAANCDAKIYTLDLPPRDHKDYVQPKVWDAELDVYPDEPGEKFHGTQYEQKIKQFFGNSQTFDFSPYYGMVDLIFVDGCHHYDFVVSDSKNALKMMSLRGIVVWHDYAVYSPGVVQALNELSREVPLANIQETSLAFTQQKG